LRFHSRPSYRVIGCCTIPVYRDPGPVTRWSRVSVLTISERRAALHNDTPVPEQMNGAVSRARLGINRWLARAPFLGYYFAPVWGTIALIARLEKPQFSLGWIFSESSNPSPSIGESGTNRCRVSRRRAQSQRHAAVGPGPDFPILARDLIFEYFPPRGTEGSNPPPSSGESRTAGIDPKPRSPVDVHSGPRHRLASTLS